MKNFVKILNSQKAIMINRDAVWMIHSVDMNFISHPRSNFPILRCKFWAFVNAWAVITRCVTITVTAEHDEQLLRLQ